MSTQDSSAPKSMRTPLSRVRGLGASHQTGWTGLIAQVLIMLGKEMDEHT